MAGHPSLPIHAKVGAPNQRAHLAFRRRMSTIARPESARATVGLQFPTSCGWQAARRWTHMLSLSSRRRSVTSAHSAACESAVPPLRAPNGKEAYERALRLGEERAHSYPNQLGETVAWRFLGLHDLREVADRELADALRSTVVSSRRIPLSTLLPSIGSPVSLGQVKSGRETVRPKSFERRRLRGESRERDAATFVNPYRHQNGR
jgi:hypothetical protein